MKKLLEESRSPNVSIWLWVHSKDVRDAGERRRLFARLHGLGVAGIKVDFLGVLNGKEPRTLRVPLSFLGPGRYHATLVRDDPTNGAAVAMEQREETARDFVDVPLRDGGGFVATFSARTGTDTVRAHRGGGGLQAPPDPP